MIGGGSEHLSWVVPLAGHLSFVLSACAYLMTDIMKLRAIAIASGVAGLFYNTLLPAGPLWLVLFWLSVFLLINGARLMGEVRNRMEVNLPAPDRALMVEAFPTMHTRDFKRLLEAARRDTHPLGAVLLEVGGSTERVSVLARGHLDEARADGRVHRRGPSSMWGELSYITQQQFDGSPCRIVVTTAHAEVLSWDYDTLWALTHRNDRMRAALMEGFVRTAGLKHGLMECDHQAHALGGAKLGAMAAHRDALRAVSAMPTG